MLSFELDSVRNNSIATSILNVMNLKSKLGATFVAISIFLAFFHYRIHIRLTALTQIESFAKKSPIQSSINNDDSFQAFHNGIDVTKYSREARNFEKLIITPNYQSILHRMLSSNTGTEVEKNGRRIIACVYLHGSSFGIFLENFIASIRQNAPRFLDSKLLVLTLDDEAHRIATQLGHRNIIQIRNISIDNGRMDKFLFCRYFMFKNISLLLMEADQIVLKNPFSGLVGDSDLEISSDSFRPSYIFSPRSIFIDKRTASPDIAAETVADNMNIGFFLMRPSPLMIHFLDALLASDDSLLLTMNHAEAWDQWRFNMIILNYLNQSRHFCYGSGFFYQHIFTANSPCIHTPHRLLIRMLPIERYLVGPAYFYVKTHCHIPGRNETHLEMNLDGQLDLPLCDSNEENRVVVVIHLAGLSQKKHYVRSRNLYFLNDTNLRVANRRIVSVNNIGDVARFNRSSYSDGDGDSDSSARVSAAMEAFVVGIAFSVAIQASFILPQIRCSLVQTSNEHIMARYRSGDYCDLDQLLDMQLIVMITRPLVFPNSTLFNLTAAINASVINEYNYRDAMVFENSLRLIGDRVSPVIPISMQRQLRQSKALLMDRIDGSPTFRQLAHSSGWMAEMWESRLCVVNLIRVVENSSTGGTSALLSITNNASPRYDLKVVSVRISLTRTGVTDRRSKSQATTRLGHLEGDRSSQERVHQVLKSIIAINDLHVYLNISEDSLDLWIAFRPYLNELLEYYNQKVGMVSICRKAVRHLTCGYDHHRFLHYYNNSGGANAVPVSIKPRIYYKPNCGLTVPSRC